MEQSESGSKVINVKHNQQATDNIENHIEIIFTNLNEKISTGNIKGLTV